MEVVIKNYIRELKKNLGNIDYNKIELLVDMFLKAYHKNKHIFVFGNGGSAATASHLACDINKGVSFGYKKRFKVICLNDNIPTIMAYSNDVSYSDVFVEQLKNLLQVEDLVVGFSASGNSKNILKAIEYANKNKANTFGVTGFNGGKLSKITNQDLIVRSDDMQKIEDIHLIISHVLMRAISKRLMELSQKAVFIDRDGVVNKKMSGGDYVKKWEEFKFLPRAKKALKILKANGYSIFIVTNQQGVARKILTEETLSHIHLRMRNEIAKDGVEIDGIYICPHDFQDNCDCRKPKVGLFLQAKKEFPYIEFKSSYLIGDSESDIIAAKKLRMRTIFIGSNNAMEKPTFYAKDLLDAVLLIKQ